MIAALIYMLCALTCALSFVLLLRSWLKSRHRLLFWSALCFAGMTMNNMLLVVDKLVFPTQVDLALWRLAMALIAILLLVFGLVWEED